MYVQYIRIQTQAKKLLQNWKNAKKNSRIFIHKKAEPKQNNDVESKKDTKTFIASQIDEEEKGTIPI